MESERRRRIGKRNDPREEADADAAFTRFICRFRAMDYDRSPPVLIKVGKTLSTYPYNYEFVNFPKDLGGRTMPCFGWPS